MATAIETQGAALGLDGGAGTLKFAVRRPDGQISYYECAGANPSLVGMDAFISRLSQGVHDALGVAGLAAGDVRSAGLALSGVDRPEQVEKIERALRERILPGLDSAWVGNDAMAALRQGAGRLRGLALIAGTGSICYAVARDGRTARVGGWGGEIGDEGSGFWVGQRALQYTCRMADGRMAPTGLIDRVLMQLRLTAPAELIPWCSALSREEFKRAAASLMPIVAEQADRGDRAARQCLEAAVGHLVRHVAAAADKLRELERTAFADAATQDEANLRATRDREDATPPERLDLICAGGLFASNEKFYHAFVAALERERVAVEPHRLTEPPVMGALALGAQAVVEARV